MKIISRTVFLGFALLTINISTVHAASNTSVTIELPKQSQAYTPGDTLEFSWTPNISVGSVQLIPTKKSDSTRYTLFNFRLEDSTAITTGEYEHTISDFFIPSGSYYVGITSVTSDDIIKSKKKITIENRPTLYFGTKSGAVNSVSVTSGNSVNLQWDAKSVKKCEASSFPKNSKWSGSVKALGTKKVRVSTPTTFYLTCENKLGALTGSLKVETGAPEYSNAMLVPDPMFVDYTYRLGASQQKALTHDIPITLFNSSQSEPIYFRVDTDKQPSWINTSYSTSQMTIEPNGTMGISAFADPSMVTKVGTYKWDLTLEGNFSNSPLKIPVTMKISK